MDCIVFDTTEQLSLHFTQWKMPMEKVAYYMIPTTWHFVKGTNTEIVKRSVVFRDHEWVTDE